MKKYFSLLLLISITSTFFSGCKKYPEGPGISVISRKERLANTWHLSSYFENGVNKTSDFNSVFQNAVISIDKAGTYSIKYKAFGLVDYNESGTWRFMNKDADFETNPSSGTGAIGLHTILRLKENELWYRDTDANGTKEYHLVP